MELEGKIGGKKMEKFRLKEIGPKEKGIYVSNNAFVCLSNTHNVSMSREEARKRGIEDKWKDGKIAVEKFAEIVSADFRFEIPRAGKRPKVIKTKELVLRCSSCGVSERILLASADSTLFEYLMQSV